MKLHLGLPAVEGDSSGVASSGDDTCSTSVSVFDSCGDGGVQDISSLVDSISLALSTWLLPAKYLLNLKNKGYENTETIRVSRKPKRYIVHPLDKVFHHYLKK